LSLNVKFWTDTHLSFLRTKKFRHYRTQSGGGVSMAQMGGHENYFTYLRIRRLYEDRKAEATPKVVRWLSREWILLSNAIRARVRRDTVVFEIGKPFLMSDRVWICTDVGRRTICAVRLKDLLRSSDSGPPYSIVEHVLDRYDMEACEVLR
jgi:hypothetical protein